MTRPRRYATNLDADSRRISRARVAESAIGRLETFALDLRKDRVVLDVVAPREAESWKAIEKALVVLVESWTQRWTSYR